MSNINGDLKGARKAIIGPSLQNLQALVITLANRDLHTLFVAETGAGKELFWNLYKAASPRTGEKMEVNCAAYSTQTLLEDRLFGHVKGAFSDAKTKTEGILKACHKGVLFLDEIGDSSEAFQVSLLRMREKQQFQALGSNKPEDVDVCFVGATSREEGIKRKDLRAAFQVVYIPSLKQREDDVPYLIQHFLQKQNDIEYISEGALSLLSGRDYPGNVRDMKKVIERTALIAASYGNTTITPDHVLVTEDERKKAGLFRDWEGLKKQIPVEEIVQTQVKEDFKPFPMKRFFEPFDDPNEVREPTRDELDRLHTNSILIAMCEQLQRIGDAVAKPASLTPDEKELECQEALIDLEGILSRLQDPSWLSSQPPSKLIDLIEYHIFQSQLAQSGQNISQAARHAGVRRANYDRRCRQLGLIGKSYRM
jgi:transcriptional regulator with GAF, ATPase, and Fis domain